MTVRFHFKALGIEIDTEVSLETANKIALGAAGVAAGTAVMATGVALGSAKIVEIGGVISLASVTGTAAAVGLGQSSTSAQLTDS